MAAAMTLEAHTHAAKMAEGDEEYEQKLMAKAAKTGEPYLNRDQRTEAIGKFNEE